MSQTDYIAFISYRHTPLDRKTAIRVQKSIERYSVPKEYQEQVGSKRLGRVFRDEDELPASSNLSASIKEALDHARFLIVICTPELPKSQWCEKEIRYFLETHERDHILAVLADGSPEESFSPFMLHTFDKEGKIAGNVEPLAANVAGDHKKYFRKEVIRIIAALIGCPFDALWQRDRRARTTALMSSSLVVAAVMAGFMGMLLLKNDQISKQNQMIQEQNDQIILQNEELSEKNQELEKQMSSALVDTGLEKYENHDIQGALEDGLKAVSGEDASTYDPRAEKLLSYATYAYMTDTIRSELVYEQANDITELKVTDDGAFCLILDEVGILRCLDTETYSVQWELPTGEIETQVYTHGQQDRVLYKTKDALICVSLKDGTPIWRYDHQLYSGNYFQAISEDGSRFALLDRFGESTYHWDDPIYAVVLDTADGSVIMKTSLDSENFEEEMIESYGTYRLHGNFSANDQWLSVLIPAKSLMEEDAEDDQVYLVSLIKVETGEVENLILFYDLDYVYGMYVSDEGDSVLQALHISRYGGLCTNLQKRAENGSYETTGEDLITSHDLSSPDGGITLISETIVDQSLPRMLSSSKTTLIFSENRLFVFDTLENKLKKTVTYTGRIVNAFWTDEKKEAFDVILSDGKAVSYDLADLEEGKWRNEVSYRELYMEDIAMAEELDGSFFPLGEDRSQVFDPRARLLSVPEGHKGQLILSRLVSDPEEKTLPFDQSEMTYSKGIQFLPDSDVGMLFFDGSGALTFNRSTGEEIQRVRFEEYSGRALPLDEDSFLCGENRYYMDGSFEAYGDPYGQEEDMYRHPNYHVRLENGRILSYLPGMANDREVYGFDNYVDYLYTSSFTPVWLDGELIGSLAHGSGGLFVNNARDLIQDNTDYYDKILMVGTNGLMMQYGEWIEVKDTKLEAEETPAFHILDALSETIIHIDDPEPDGGALICAMGTKTHQMAVAYENGSVYLFDIDGNTNRKLEKVYARGEVITACFSPGDEYYLLQTRSGYVDIYDTGTGSLLFSEKLNMITAAGTDGISSGTLKTELDREKGLLLITKNRYDHSDLEALAILDLKSFTVIGEIRYSDRILAMDTVYHQVYTKRNRLSHEGNEFRVIVYDIYDLDHLKERAQNLLEDRK